MNLTMLKLWAHPVLVTAVAGLVLLPVAVVGDTSAPPVDYIKPTIVGFQDNYDRGKITPMPPNGAVDTAISIPCNSIFPQSRISYHGTLLVQNGEAPLTYTMSGNTVTFNNPNPPVTVDGLTFDKKTGELEMYAPPTCGQLDGKGVLVLSAVDNRGNKTTPDMSIPFKIVQIVP